MRHKSPTPGFLPRAFTLIELLVTITIISILASLTLAGLGVARERAKADRTETTIRKIHEVVMPHYEQFTNRSLSPPSFSYPSSPSLEAIGRKGIALIGKRRMMTLELPDGWRDLLQVTAAGSPQWTVNDQQSGISRRFYGIANDLRNNNRLTTVAESWGDSECLWLSVMQGGYADPGIISHFREDEFGDRDGDGMREFIDGWGKPIRFLRWAPGFISRYQPALSTGTDSHDAFDLAGVDPFAKNTLFPLIFSMGADGESDIASRDQPALVNFSYPEIGYDPYFVARNATCHLRFGAVLLGEYAVARPAVTAFGTFESRVVSSGGIVTSDDVHNHAMSR